MGLETESQQHFHFDWLLQSHLHQIVLHAGQTHLQGL
uniref:Uncharacterized protein n=1 Tax=Arundo donax TaxID=35708 RepID=A0A0A9AQ32_ARUDO